MRKIAPLLISYFWLIILLFVIKPMVVEAKMPDSYLTIVSLVRGRNQWVNQEKNWLEKQGELIVDQGFASTWLLDFDALEEQTIREDLAAFGNNQEIGLLLEITETLADELGLPYNRLVYRYEPQNIFLSGYSTKQRQRILDWLFSCFYDRFGYYPKSVGAWFIDSWSLKYLQETYQIETAVLAAEQYGTDQHTVRGHIWQAPFYPSRKHVLKPAESEAEKLDIVVIQWAAREPLRGYGYQSKHSNFSVQANDYTQQGLDENYFEKLLNTYLFNPFSDFNQLTIGIEVGQEGAKYFSEFIKLLEKVETYQNQLQILTMAQFSQAFRDRFADLGESRIVYWQDEENPEQWAVWYNSNYYRIGLVADNEGVFIRDLRVYTDDQDDLFFAADRRRELFRQTEAIIDEVGLKKKWQIWAEPARGPKITKETEGILISFGDKMISLEENEFLLNFKPVENGLDIENLDQKQISGWFTFFPKAIEVKSPSKNWLLVSLLFLILYLWGLIKFKQSRGILLALLLALISISVLSFELLTLIPFNELGLTYFIKLNSAKGVLIYFLTPLLYILLGLGVFSFVRRFSRSILLSLVVEFLFFFKSNLGWLLVLYRKLPLDPSLIVGVKDNIFHFIWFFDFGSSDKLAYAFSAGQMNIDLFGKMVNFPTLLLPLAITFFQLMNLGILFMGLVYLLIFFVKRKNYFAFTALLGLLWLSPLAVNQIDVRLPTLPDIFLLLFGVAGVFLLVEWLKKRFGFSRIALAGLLLFMTLPSFCSLLKRNKELSFRLNPYWSDRGKTMTIFQRQSRLTDSFLWQIDQPAKTIVYVPQGIEQYFFIDTEELKNDLELMMENSYAIVGRVKL